MPCNVNAQGGRRAPAAEGSEQRQCTLRQAPPVSCLEQDRAVAHHHGIGVQCQPLQRQQRIVGLDYDI